MPKPGTLLLHPLALCAVGLLLVNDHWLKFHAPGLITGKLSDFAGLLFFPLLLNALVPRVPVRAAAVATAVVFALVKTWPPATSAFDWTLGTLQWPAQALFSLLRSGPLPTLTPVVLTPDPTDLVALTVLPVPVWIANSQGNSR